MLAGSWTIMPSTEWSRRADRARRSRSWYSPGAKSSCFINVSCVLAAETAGTSCATETTEAAAHRTGLLETLGAAASRCTIVLEVVEAFEAWRAALPRGALRGAGGIPLGRRGRSARLRGAALASGALARRRAARGRGRALGPTLAGGRLLDRRPPSVVVFLPAVVGLLIDVSVGARVDVAASTLDHARAVSSGTRHAGALRARARRERA